MRRNLLRSCIIQLLEEMLVQRKIIVTFNLRDEYLSLRDCKLLIIICFIKDLYFCACKWYTALIYNVVE